MPKKWPSRITAKRQHKTAKKPGSEMREPKPKTQKTKSRVRYFLVAMGVVAVNLLLPVTSLKVEAASCPDVKLIFARGSGEERWTDQNYKTFKAEIESKLKLTKISYEFEDLNYPAISVADPWVLLSTYIGRGEAYKFGASVAKGINQLISEVNTTACPNTKYVVAGYSQGAMLVSKALRTLDADKIIYAATFGDPKIYLPEGAGLVPAACSGKNLSEYRVYVPDCQAYVGMLGSYRPYQPEDYAGKVGTWCNKMDIFCSSHFSIKSHTSYVSDGLYADASKVIFDKITKALGVENKYVSTHDVAFLIDSTSSMQIYIDQYKSEALELARQTIESGGRVALYDYRDLIEGYDPVERCNFETCTLETFKTGLDQIKAELGSDTPESLLSAGVTMMKKLNWNYGSTKSVVVLTDASYHDPDLDGTTFADLVTLSKKIDPVNFYIVTRDVMLDFYGQLAGATGGGVAEMTSDLGVLTRTIMKRYDSLPQAEELSGSETAAVLPVLSGAEFEWISDSEVRVSWKNTGSQTMLALDDLPLGVTTEKSVVLTGLDSSLENVLTLIPIGESVRGESVSLALSSGGYGEWEDYDWSLEVVNRNGSSELEVLEVRTEVIIPKAPNTGRK